MSKKRREKAKAKAARHTAKAGTQPSGQRDGQAPEPRQAGGTRGSAPPSVPVHGHAKPGKTSSQEIRFLRSADHLQRTSPEWQRFYLGIRSAIKEMD